MNIQKLMKQAQQMQEKLLRELSDTVSRGQRWRRVVEVKMSGQKQLLVDQDRPGRPRPGRPRDALRIW